MGSQESAEAICMMVNRGYTEYDPVVVFPVFGAWVVFVPLLTYFVQQFLFAH